MRQTYTFSDYECVMRKMKPKFVRDTNSSWYATCEIYESLFDYNRGNSFM